MNYINSSILDLDFRINHEILNHQFPSYIYAEINKGHILQLGQKLKTKSISPSIEKIINLAFHQLQKKYLKKYPITFKKCIVVTFNKELNNTIIIRGFIFTKNILTISHLWKYGKIEISEIKNIKASIYHFTDIYQYKDKSKYFVKLYISKHFGTNVYNTIKNKITYKNEIFKPIPLHEKYYISKNGIVLSTKRNKPIVLKQKLYYKKPYVTLYTHNKTKSISIIVLLAITYLKLNQIKQSNNVRYKNHILGFNNLNNVKISLNSTYTPLTNKF